MLVRAAPHELHVGMPMRLKWQLSEGALVATITVEGVGHFEADSTTRLVKAIEGHGIDILHRCGGNARCTTCRVEFISGEPQQMTKAEYERLVEREILGQFRLSCQILCDHDMHVRV